MFHFVQAIQNTKGDALIGYYVKAVNSDGDVVDIYADESATPIVSESGVANAAKVDSNGNVSFWIASGEYGIDIYATDAATHVGRISDLPMRDLAESVGLADTKLALSALVPNENDAVMLLVDGEAGLFVFSATDLSAEVAADPGQDNYIAPDSDNTGASGAWVRQTGSGLGTVSTVSVATANGFSGSVANASTTPAITLSLDDGAITYAKMQDVSATSRVLGRITTGAGDVEELTAANLKTILALSQSDISGLTTTDSPQFAAINIGAASDTTLARSGAGDLTVEGNAIYRAGGTDVPVADGGTGASDAATARTNLGLGSIATQAASSVSITGGSVTGITDLAVADGGTGASTAASARTNLGLVIGTDVQAFDAELAAIAGLTSAADRLPYFTGSGTASLATFTAAGRALVDDADASAQRTTLGLGTIATQASSSVSITGGSITGITDLAVADGGTGASTASAARTNLAAAAASQTAECISGFIASPSDKSYTIVLNAPHGGTITDVTTKSASGTCTATWKINTTALGGTANSVSSTETTQSHASSNVFAAGDDIVLTVSGNSSCADMSFTIKYTRTLS